MKVASVFICSSWDFFQQLHSRDKWNFSCDAARSFFSQKQCFSDLFCDHTEGFSKGTFPLLFPVYFPLPPRNTNTILESEDPKNWKTLHVKWLKWHQQSDKRASNHVGISQVCSVHLNFPFKPSHLLFVQTVFYCSPCLYDLYASSILERCHLEHVSTHLPTAMFWWTALWIVVSSSP